MVLTRSQAQDLRRPKKIKFDEEDVNIIEKELVLDDEEDRIESDNEKDDNEESESDDDAPEEESTTKSKHEILSKQRELEQRQQELKKSEKAKRKSLDLRNKQQQQLKKESKVIEPLPEFLPDDISSIINSKPKVEEAVMPKNKHVKLEDKVSILEEKLRQLKKDKKKSQVVKKGPVHVAVLDKKPLVPKSEHKILKNKDKWLNRKSLNRK